MLPGPLPAGTGAGGERVPLLTVGRGVRCCRARCQSGLEPAGNGYPLLTGGEGGQVLPDPLPAGTGAGGERVSLLTVGRGVRCCRTRCQPGLEPAGNGYPS